jgi:hypothetical protein
MKGITFCFSEFHSGIAKVETSVSEVNHSDKILALSYLVNVLTRPLVTQMPLSWLCQNLSLIPEAAGKSLFQGPNHPLQKL